MRYTRIIGHVLGYIDSRNKPKVFFAMMLQSSLSLLDIVGIGLFGSLAYTLTSGQLPDLLQNNFLLKGLSPDQGSGVLLGAAIVFFSLKGLLTPTVLGISSKIVSDNAAQLSSSLTKNFFARSLKIIERESSQDYLYTVGVSALSIVNIGIGSMLILLSEVSLLVLITSMLTIVNPMLSAITISYFLLVLLILQKKISGQLSKLHSASIHANVSAANVFMDMYNNYRELASSQKFDLFDREYQEHRSIESKSSIRIFFLNVMPKYIFEVAFYFGAGLVFIFLTMTESDQSVLVQLTIFIAGGSRILPSIIRIQGAMSGLGSVEKFISRVNSLENLSDEILPCKREIRIVEARESAPVIEISDLRFKYSPNSLWSLSIPYLSISQGERVALVGESGSGKSTLADLILGLQEFNSGRIILSVRSMNKIGYVPQKLSLLNRSILENVALGVPAELIDHEKVRNSLQKTGMLNFVESLPHKLTTNVGERGVFLSGGQMQRIAISRALYTRPELLLLDEATSALDSTSEDLITNVLKKVDKSVTTIVIAHRLSTVQNVDRVIYLKSGEILGQGTFNEVRSQIPDFDQQANLMGL